MDEHSKDDDPMNYKHLSSAEEMEFIDQINIQQGL